MTDAAPTPSDRHAKAQLESLIAYAESTGRTLLAAILSEAADVFDDGRFASKTDGD